MNFYFATQAIYGKNKDGKHWMFLKHNPKSRDYAVTDFIRWTYHGVSENLETVLDYWSKYRRSPHYMRRMELDLVTYASLVKNNDRYQRYREIVGLFASEDDPRPIVRPFEMVMLENGDCLESLITCFSDQRDVVVNESIVARLSSALDGVPYHGVLDRRQWDGAYLTKIDEHTALFGPSR